MAVNGTLQVNSNVDGASFSVSGTPGVNYSGALSTTLGGSITIQNGIITAFTPMP
jgi:hypothetical protein